MKISEARKAIEQKHDYGLISDEEARRFQNRLSQIQARRDISWAQKEALYSVYA